MTGFRIHKPSEQTKKRIVKMSRENFSHKEVGRRFSISQQLVDKIVKEYNEAEQASKPKLTLTDHEFYDEYGVSGVQS